MAALLETHLQVSPQAKAGFLSAARSTLAAAEAAGAVAALRQIQIGGDHLGDYLIRLTFADQQARADYLDIEAADGLHLEGVTARRRFLDEPAGCAPGAQPQVIASLSWIVAPGREREADQALIAGTEVRRPLGIESHLYVAAYAGAQTGLRYFEIHAESQGRLTRDAAEVVANRGRLGGLGPIPKAMQMGVFVMGASTISTLVSL